MIRGHAREAGRRGRTGAAAADGEPSHLNGRREELLDLADKVDSLVVRLMSRYGVTLMRIALGLVFIWFGALKIADESPVADLVADTVYWLPRGFFVPFLGAWEVAVGIGLLLGVALRATLFLFFLQMVGTFLVLVLRPGEAFASGNPLLLTVTGEFVVKNLVLIAAGLVVGSTVRGRLRASRSADT